MEIKNTFIGGRMSKDLNERLVAEGEYTHAENIRIVTPDGSNAGSIRLSLGNTQLTTQNFGAGAIALGHVVDNSSNTVYSLVINSSGHGYLMEYDIDNDVETILLEDTRTGAANVLNLQEDSYPIQMNLLNDSENGKKFIFWSDGVNEPRWVEVAYAQTLGVSSFTEDQINVIRTPPLEPPIITTSTVSTDDSGPLSDKFYEVAFRYKYVYGEYSVLSPFSQVAFQAKDMDYDTSTNTFSSMVNKYERYGVSFLTGSSEVVGYEFVYKEVGSNASYVFETFDKAEEGWSDNVTESFFFYGNKAFRAFPENELLQTSDNVPITAEAQEMIQNRLMYGNYKEGYDMVRGGNTITPSFTVDYTTTAITPSGTSFTTMKNIASYELGIVYYDGKGRMTTPFTSEGSSVFIPNSTTGEQVKLQATITSLAPEFAEYFKFFIKEYRTDYYNIITDTFFSDANDIRYHWIRIENTDVSKVAKGDYIYIKSTTVADSGTVSPPQKVEILEIATQEAGFTDYAVSSPAPAGIYMKTENLFTLIGNQIDGNAMVIETEGFINNVTTFYESKDIIHSINTSFGYHTPTGTGNTAQTAIQDAVVTLPDFNAYGWASYAIESNRIGNSFNGKSLVYDTRPLAPIEDYRQITRKASLTYGGVYENTTGVNHLNKFDAANINFKDMDTDYGSIQKLHSKDTDLYVFQEDKTHRILYNKDVLFDADGQGNIRESSKVLGQEVAYAGEYGIGLEPESFAFYANRIYHIDRRRGALMRLSTDGYTEISKSGLHNYFRTLGNKSGNIGFVGGYNPYDDVYMLYTDETGTANTLAFNETSKGFTSFYSFKPEIMLYSDNRLYSFKNGHLYLHDDASADINTFYGTYYPSKINVVINQEPSEIKVFQAINIEGTGAWDVVIKAFRNDSEDFSQSTLVEEDFTNKEGRWYSTIKRNEVLGDKSSKSIYGLGEVSNISGDDITIDGGIMNSSICAGDEIYNTSDQLVGVVESVSGMVITLTSPAANIVVTDYVFGKKDDKIEGSQIRGYNAILEMETDSTANRELYAVNTKVFKSYR